VADLDKSLADSGQGRGFRIQEPVR
jgi:hypothetical protein